MERHISIGLDGDVPVPVSNSDDSEHFHCPFCKYAGAKIMVENHIKGHASVRHQEFTMFKCGLACRGATHFHCCYCPATIVNRLQFLRHLKIHQEEEPHAATPARHQDTPTQHPVSPAQGPKFSARHHEAGLRAVELLYMSEDLDEEEIHDLREPFLFLFTVQADYEEFCVEMMDKRQLQVFCGFDLQ
ncbi:uncharacterized protein LOC121639378 isoform X3 [Melanotaenia boesemani]|uniref:uncharacterized protein LOC121639378 isoform X3 n=1 Tax=Melanotaenia boesemani TaxID=1250792 RepID=UPI001C054705|nr:uncharacterized protein LOC121639378 isoform X3 [Melanotaenia boesemani]